MIREAKRGSGAAEHCDKLAPFQLTELHSLPQPGFSQHNGLPRIKGLAAVRHFDQTDDRFGSFAPDDTPTDGHGMSALPPIATELLRRTELTLRANSDRTRRSKQLRYSMLISGHEVAPTK